MTSGFRPWVTIYGQEGGMQWGGMVQPAEEWLDTGTIERVAVELQALCVSHCTLSIESGVDIQSGEPWETLCFLTQAGRARVIAEASEMTTGPKLYRYLRWRVTEAGNAPWTVCFKADVVEK
jgi:hypothetical protein